MKQIIVINLYVSARILSFLSNADGSVWLKLSLSEAYKAWLLNTA